MSKLVLFLLCLFDISRSTTGWTVSPIVASPSNLRPSTATITRYQSNTDSNEDDMVFSSPQERSEAQRQQEMIFEDLSLKGAKQIAQMEIPERAKRAMLAEAVEDRIFELTEFLESLVDEQGMIAEEDRPRAVDVAKQTKNLQLQYNDLVSGNPSTILDALNAIGSKKD